MKELEYVFLKKFAITLNMDKKKPFLNPLEWKIYLHLLLENSIHSGIIHSTMSREQQKNIMLLFDS